MKISIIIPVYNVAQHLPKCLESILTQGLVDYEVILINDGSYDNSQAICKEWCSKSPAFRLINHDKNQGLSAARNTGIKEAKGEVITFVDSDDYLAQGTLSACLEEMEDADVLEYPIMVDHLSAKEYPFHPIEGTYDFQTWMKRDGYTHCYACNKLFKRSLWGDTTFPIGRYYEDIFTIPYVLQRATKIRGTKHGMYYYCKRDGSISNTPKLRALSDYVEALVQLQKLPENQQNFALYLRSLNAQLSYHQHGGKEKIVPHRPLPLSFILSPNLTLHQRIKALWFRLTYRPRT